MFNAVKDVDKLVSYSTRIFSRLGPSVSKYVAVGRDAGHQPKEERRSLQILHLPAGMPGNKC